MVWAQAMDAVEVLRYEVLYIIRTKYPTKLA